MTKEPHLEIEASGSKKEKEKMGDREATPTANFALADREVFPRKLKLPIFDVGNPNGWLFGAKLFFEINKLTSGEKLRAVVVCLKGKALAWYYYEDSADGQISGNYSSNGFVPPRMELFWNNYFPSSELLCPRLSSTI